jgi:hypothetical protein
VYAPAESVVVVTDGTQVPVESKYGVQLLGTTLTESSAIGATVEVTLLSEYPSTIPVTGNVVVSGVEVRRTFAPAVEAEALVAAETTRSSNVAKSTINQIRALPGMRACFPGAMPAIREITLRAYRKGFSPTTDRATSYEGIVWPADRISVRDRSGDSE